MKNCNSIQEKYGNKKLNTYIQKLVRFYQAEDYHQKYWLRCQTAILKKVGRKSFYFARIS